MQCVGSVSGCVSAGKAWLGSGGGERVSQQAAQRNGGSVDGQMPRRPHHRHQGTSR